MRLSYKVYLFLASIVLLSVLASCNRNYNDHYKIPDDAVILETQVAEVYGNADGIVTLISDDGFYESGVYFNDLLGKYRLKGTVAGSVCFVDPDIDGWNQILADGNIELVNHSYGHKKMAQGTPISNNYFSLMHQIVDSDKYFERKFGTEQIVFVWPENAMCDKGYSILKDNGFWASRSDVRGFNSLSPEDGREPGEWYGLCLYGIKDDGVDASVRNVWIDTAAEEKTWLIEMWHWILPEDNGLFQTMLVDEAAEHMAYIESKVNEGVIWNANFTDAVKYIREKQNCNVYSFMTGNQLHIYVELTNRDMSYDTFNHPLTIGVILPSEKETVYYDVIPGEELVVNLD